MYDARMDEGRFLPVQRHSSSVWEPWLSLGFSLLPIVLSVLEPFAVVPVLTLCVYRLDFCVPLLCLCPRLWIPGPRWPERDGHALASIQQV